MCKVCHYEKIDSLFFNGVQKKKYPIVLYSLKPGKFIKITLCYLHSIEIFQMGERHFCKKYPYLKQIYNKPVSKESTQQKKELFIVK